MELFKEANVVCFICCLPIDFFFEIPVDILSFRDCLFNQFREEKLAE